MKKTFSRIFKLVGVGAAFLSPALAFAATTGCGVPTGNGVDGLFNCAFGILDELVPLFVAIAVVVFLYGVLSYVLAGGDEEKRAAGRQTIIYGIIAIFVMVSVYGLVNLLAGSIGFTNNNNLDTPKILPNNSGQGIY